MRTDALNVKSPQPRHCTYVCKPYTSLEHREKFCTPKSITEKWEKKKLYLKITRDAGEEFLYPLGHVEKREERECSNLHDWLLFLPESEEIRESNIVVGGGGEDSALYKFLCSKGKELRSAWTNPHGSGIQTSMTDYFFHLESQEMREANIERWWWGVCTINSFVHTRKRSLGLGWTNSSRMEFKPL